MKKKMFALLLILLLVGIASPITCHAEHEDITHTSTQANENTGNSAFALSNNPVANIAGTLTSDTPEHFYFFSITETSRFYLAKINSDNSNYTATLYLYNKDSDEASPTKLSGTSGQLMPFNGLPVHDYILKISSTNNTYGQSYTLDINASNPSSDITKVHFLSDDLYAFVFETHSGDIYSNGHLLYNTATHNSPDLKWEKVNEFRWGSGYEQHTYSIFNVKVKKIGTLMHYSNKNISADYVIPIYCDIDTAFTDFYSYYQSGVNPVFKRSGIDETGRNTPRKLDSDDFEHGHEHVLIYDVTTSTVIDFLSVLYPNKGK